MQEKNRFDRMSLPLDLPEDIRTAQLGLLKGLGIGAEDWLGSAREIAKSVMSMSAFYAKHPEKSSPWSESWAQVAYLAYYMPLNWWRLCGVVSRGQQINFFDGFDHYIDFGSGLGSLGMAFDHAGLQFKHGHCVERSSEAVGFHRKLARSSLTDLEWSSTLPAQAIKPKTLAIFSYSFTELTELPSWVNNCEGLLIIEPSTRDDARRLQQLRSKLLKTGWHVWGPCTHVEPCPLLEKSERDWCHDRFEWIQPDWLKCIEAYMPIKNGTLPCSWLMMRRTPPSQDYTGKARMTGDLQEFKGFAKQLICRGGQREFVAWQRRDFKKGYPDLRRGEIVFIKEDLILKGNEIRAAHDDDVTLV
jgi:hypothetical protein